LSIINYYYYYYYNNFGYYPTFIAITTYPFATSQHHPCLASHGTKYLINHYIFFFFFYS